MSPVVGSSFRAMPEAGESLIAQLHSQGRVTTPRLENKKKSTRNRNFKSKRTLYACVETSDLLNDTKNTPQNLVRLSL
jgi:hypothetical protein